MSGKSAKRLMAETAIIQVIRESIKQELTAMLEREPTRKELTGQFNHRVSNAITDATYRHGDGSRETYQAVWDEINAFGKKEPEA